MKPHHFIILTVTALAAFLVAAVVHAGRQPWTESRPAVARLAPALARDAANIARVEVKHGESTLTLDRKGDAWLLKERDGYPVKPDLALGLIARLAQADLVEPKTRSPANHAVLELEDPAGKGAKSRLVRLLDDKGAALADVVIGKRRSDAFGPSKGGTYLRKANDPQAWLATGDIDVPSDISGWVAARVVDLPADKISRVWIEIPEQAALAIERDKPGKYKLSAMPEGRKLKEGNLIDETVRAVASFDLEDMRKLAAPPAGAAVSIVKVLSDGGPEVLVRLRKDAGADWISLTATGAEGDAKKAADEINTRASGWEFKIPAAKAIAVLKRLADFLEPS